jgi:hypothetical protein
MPHAPTCAVIPAPDDEVFAPPVDSGDALEVGVVLGGGGGGAVWSDPKTGAQAATAAEVTLLLAPV